MTADLTEPGFAKRVATTLWGDKATATPGLVEIVGRHDVAIATHQRVIFGVEAEALRGLLPAVLALEKKFTDLAEAVENMSDGKKLLVTWVGLAVSSLTGIASLLAAGTALYVALTK